MTFKKNIVKDVCAVKGCCNKSRGRKICSTCSSRQTRAKDVVRYTFYSRKHNAKRRGIPWHISLEWFRKFCHKVKYIGFTGRSAEGYTLDRIHNDRGYTEDNIQVMTNRDNVKKYFTYDWQTKTVYELKPVEIDKEDLPF